MSTERKVGTSDTEGSFLLKKWLSWLRKDDRQINKQLLVSFEKVVFVIQRRGWSGKHAHYRFCLMEPALKKRARLELFLRKRNVLSVEGGSNQHCSGSNNSIRFSGDQRRSKVNSLETEENIDTIVENIISCASDLNVQRFQCTIEIKVGSIWAVIDGFGL
ncbi:hypothetical protein POM88_005215 [Heracleum sosnowskyi]|uniref:Uncharacterized protein n=1 Tax=Heracleum sosnowskyi TaxID=360622 RepID=A0AAD8JPK9_9APIA|nr:hypothetical protein POM88_005215 [Heracleum sosnowskyi]